MKPAFELPDDWFVENDGQRLVLDPEKVKAAFEARVALQGWQDIATAPKDGTAIWLLIGGRMYIGFGEEPNWLCNRARWFASAGITRKADMDRPESMPDSIFGCHGVDVAPTHWQPLPQPPTASDREERR